VNIMPLYLPHWNGAIHSISRQRSEMSSGNYNENRIVTN
jgi:hypothetical protein